MKKGNWSRIVLCVLQEGGAGDTSQAGPSGAALNFYLSVGVITFPYNTRFAKKNVLFK